MRDDNRVNICVFPAAFTLPEKCRLTLFSARRTCWWFLSCDLAAAGLLFFTGVNSPQQQVSCMDMWNISHGYVKHAMWRCQQQQTAVDLSDVCCYNVADPWEFLQFLLLILHNLDAEENTSVKADWSQFLMLPRGVSAQLRGVRLTRSAVCRETCAAGTRA